MNARSCSDVGLALRGQEGRGTLREIAPGLRGGSRPFIHMKYKTATGSRPAVWNDLEEDRHAETRLQLQVVCEAGVRKKWRCMCVEEGGREEGGT